MRTRLTHLTIALLAFTTLIAAAQPRDGAVITDSGSTNTTAYSIKFWSDGSALLVEQQHAQRYFRIDADTIDRFFRDVRAARNDPGTPHPCMKSASFGTRTQVLWHGWNSPDLQCPPFSPSVEGLVHDVRLIQATANVDTRIRRLPLPPREPRMIPSSTPEVQPT